MQTKPTPAERPISTKLKTSPRYVTRLVRLSDSMIAWNPKWGACARGGKPGEIGVCKHPDNGQLRHLSMWVKPGKPKESVTESKLRLMIEVWHIACRDGVALADIHAALSSIPEYTDMLSEDFSICETNA